MKTKQKFAVIRIKGFQYLVSEGDELLIPHADNKLENEVLLLSNLDQATIGKPSLSDVKVKLKVLKPKESGEKLKILKYKAKSRYRKRIGFRPLHTMVLVEKIS